MREAGTEPDMNFFITRTPAELERKRSQKKGAGRGANPGGKGGKEGKATARAVVNKQWAPEKRFKPFHGYPSENSFGLTPRSSRF